jgi:putative addiction module component (TIGR02574 family)
MVQRTMSSKGTNLLDQVLALPESERAEFAEALLSSLPANDADADDDAEFRAELRRRVEEAKSDPTSVIPWAEVKRRIGIKDE